MKIFSGNHLTSVNDAVSGDHEVDFVKRGTGVYTYWENGALKGDENEQITNITYNTFLNQPEQVTLSDGRWIKHIYDGSGTLIKTEYSTGEYWEFTPGIVFKNGAFYQMVTPEGRAIYEGETWKLEFDYKDHTGNTRASFKADGNRLVHTAKTDTDPWGVILKTGQENSFQNRHEMQGHEREKTFGLNRINFGARTYNPTIVKWDRIDNKAEKWNFISPYAYTLNNPLRFGDPDGNDIIIWKYTHENGRYQAKQVSFNDLGKKERNLLLQMAMHKEGNKLLSNFVNGKLNWGDVATINGNSNEDLNILFSEGKDSYNISSGGNGHIFGEVSKSRLNKKKTVEVDIVNQNEESAAITFGHEMFLHLKEFTDNPKGKETTAHQDHKGWAENSTKNSKIFNQYIQYLRGWYDNLKQFNEAENEKRRSNNENVISGN